MSQAVSVIASEAKQSSEGQEAAASITSRSAASVVGDPDAGASRRELDCFASLAMTAERLAHIT